MSDPFIDSTSPTCPGASLLRAFMDEHGLTIQAVANALPSPHAPERPMTKTPVIGWLKHGARPARETQEALARWTGDRVPVSSWLRAGERRAEDRVRPFEAKQ